MRNLILFIHLILPSLLWPTLGLALSAKVTPEWILTDLTTIPELAAFLGNSDAVITVNNEVPGMKDKPTILITKLKAKADGPLRTAAEWLAFLKPHIKDVRRLNLKQDVSQNGRFMLEFLSRNKEANTDLHSLYLANQNADHSITLFVYDGVGPSTSRNLPLVRALYTTLDQKRLMEMYRDDLQRRETLQRTAPAR